MNLRVELAAMSATAILTSGCFTTYTVAAKAPESLAGAPLVEAVDEAIRPLGFQRNFQDSNGTSWVYTGRVLPKEQEVERWRVEDQSFSTRVLGEEPAPPDIGFDTAPLPTVNGDRLVVTVWADTATGRLVIRDRTHQERTALVDKVEAALRDRVSPENGLDFQRVDDFP